MTGNYGRSNSVLSTFTTRERARLTKKRFISDESLSAMMVKAGQKLDAGLSSETEKIILAALENYSHTPAGRAELTCLLSLTLETQGRYQESLETIEKYDDEILLSEIGLEMQISVIVQLAIAFNNTNDYPKAVALLNYALEQAKEANLSQTFGKIYVAFSRVYRKLNECPIARDHAEKALDYYRESGDWKGMAGGLYQPGYW